MRCRAEYHLHLEPLPAFLVCHRLFPRREVCRLCPRDRRAPILYPPCHRPRLPGLAAAAGPGHLCHRLRMDLDHQECECLTTVGKEACHRPQAGCRPRLTCSTAVDPLAVIMDPQAVTMDPLVVTTEGRPAAIMDLQAAIMEDPLAVVDTMAGDRVGVDLTRRPAGDPRDPLAACTTGIDRRCPRCHQDTKPTHFYLFFVSLFI